jgi:hypothetical protein
MHSTMDFELILEGPENMVCDYLSHKRTFCLMVVLHNYTNLQRRYLGSYRTAAMPFEYGMKLSEWMCLDEQARLVIYTPLDLN